MKRKNIIISLICLISISVWMASGFLFKQKPQKKHFKKVVNIKIGKKKISSQYFEPFISIPAKIKSKQSLILISQINGIVDSVKVKSGDFVKKGKLLIVIDGKPALAKLRQAQVNYKEELVKYKTNKKLFDKKLISNSGFENTKIKLANAKSSLENSINLFNKHYIKAPFSGNVGVVRVNKNENINLGTNIIDIENKSSFKAVAFVSIKQRTMIAKGNNFTFDVNGKGYNGKITAISSTPEKLVKTYRLEGSLENKNFIAEQPIKIKIKLNKVKAHFIPSSLFNIDENGDLAIKILNNNNQVELRKVKILQETSKGSWITGLDETTTILTDGAGFAKVGEFITD